MNRVLGLDISTSVTGYTVLDDSFNIIKMGHIDFGKCKTLWEKADLGDSVLANLLATSGVWPVTAVYIEESLLGFTAGASSAQTIMTLSKFNALLSYFVRNRTGLEPNFVAANSARKQVGIKLIQKKKCGISHKEQAFMWATTEGGPLASVEFPKTRTGKFKPFVGDEVDSYIVARCGVIYEQAKGKA